MRILLSTAALLVVSWAQAAPPAQAGAELDPSLLQAFQPLPKVFENKANPLSEAKVQLGRMLFFDQRLSKNHDVSCNSCHALDKFGVDGKPLSPGHKGQLGGRNSPTVYNAGGYIAQFWDGRAVDLEEQAKGPVLNPVEMAMPDDEQVVQVLESIPQYVTLFKKAFPQDKTPVNFHNMALAIAAFERQLVTPSRFDQYLNGNKAALTAEEKQGLKTFVEVGCTSCHNGAALGGTTYQKLGLVEPYPDQSDLGRFAVTHKPEDKMFFRVPTLRNVAKTGPYFHDGKVATLEEAVRLMARHQLGRKLEDKQVKQLAAFLHALTGELPTAYIKAPALPKSTKKTPPPRAD